MSVIDCGDLEDPPNGTVSFSTTTYNSVANYSCITGYALTGNSSRTCLDLGTWSDSQPTCSGKYFGYTLYGVSTLILYGFNVQL